MLVGVALRQEASDPDKPIRQHSRGPLTSKEGCRQKATATVQCLCVSIFPGAWSDQAAAPCSHFLVGGRANGV